MLRRRRRRGETPRDAVAAGAPAVGAPSVGGYPGDAAGPDPAVGWTASPVVAADELRELRVDSCADIPWVMLRIEAWPDGDAKRAAQRFVNQRWHDLRCAERPVPFACVEVPYPALPVPGLGGWGPDGTGPDAAAWVDPHPRLTAAPRVVPAPGVAAGLGPAAGGPPSSVAGVGAPSTRPAGMSVLPVAAAWRWEEVSAAFPAGVAPHGDGPASEGSAPPSPGWFQDPCGSRRRLRWWNGHVWTAWVRPRGAREPAIAWIPGITAVARPQPSVGPRPGMPRGWRWAAIAAAVALVLGVGATGAASQLGSGSDNTWIRQSVAYSDPAAGFALRYPRAWQLERKTPGDGIRFITRTAAGSQPSSLSIVVAPQVDHLPELSHLAADVTDKLRQRVRTIELEGASRARLDGQAALRLSFVDRGATPAATIQQLVSLTSTRRPITVTITDPTPPNGHERSQLRALLASLSFVSTG